MRSLGLVVVLAACGGSSDGAVLSFAAPDGPGAASRIELVLASADPEAMTTTLQRMHPGAPNKEEVVYYRQRSTVDAIVGIPALDGFAVRIEPDETIVPDEAFIPFALIFDAADVLIAVGTVDDEAGDPTTVIIRPGMVVNYDVTVRALAPDVDAAGIGPGEGHAVGCDSDAGPWRSGAVWKRADGPQIRLLLPDLAEDAAAIDAMLRSSDLDCDEYPAGDAADCDDLRGGYHPGQIETCDGEDKDCDGRRLELVEGCAVTNSLTCGAMGVALCAEGPNETPVQGTCAPSAACACARGTAGTIPPGCTECSLGWMAATGGATPCAPAIGKLHFEQCTSSSACTVDLVDVIGPWEIGIAAAPAGPFSVRVTGITGDVFLRAKYLGPTISMPGAPTLGAVYLGVTGALQTRPTIQPVNLDLEVQALTACAPGTGNNSMRCYQ